MFTSLPSKNYLEQALLEKCEPLEEEILTSTLNIINWDLRRIYGYIGSPRFEEILEILFYPANHLFVQGPLLELIINRKFELLHRLDVDTNFVLLEAAPGLNKTSTVYIHDYLLNVKTHYDDNIFHDYYPKTAKLKLFRLTKSIIFWPHILVKDGAKFYLVKNYAFQVMLDTIKANIITESTMGNMLYPTLFSLLLNRRINSKLTNDINRALEALNIIDKIKNFGFDFRYFDIKIMKFDEKGGEVYENF